MDQGKKPLLDGIGTTTRKRRTQVSRRPKPEGQQSMTDQSPTSTPLSDDASKVSSDENIGESSSGGKMFNLNQCVSRSLQVVGSDSGSTVVQRNGVIDGAGSENKPKKFKLKVGGVTRTIQTKSNSNAGSGSSGSMAKVNQSSENANQQQKLNHQLDKKSSLQGIPWKDFSKGSISIGREDNMGRTTSRNASEKQGDKSDSVRKSKRVPKRRVLDDEFDEDGEDDEIRYLEKLKTSKITGYKEPDAESARKLQKGNAEYPGKVNRDGKRSRSGDIDYEEDEELSSDGEAEGTAKKKQKKGLLSELPVENKREISLTTRQRALLSKDASVTAQIEFPNGLPPAPSRKQKEKLSEVEQQLKKVEAAQRRRLQNEKAARESEAEAIRKILGQDSSRKKREEKMRKRQEELAQEKAVSAEMLSSNIIRTVLGPTGTTVTFPQEMGFPKIFESKTSSYPAPREKCSGPSCTNPYKYRDSKSKLPLCSLQCYKAVNEKVQTEQSC